MKKFKIIFLADNNSYNVIINNIIKDLNFKFLEVEILYTQFTNIKKGLWRIKTIKCLFI